MQRYSNVVQDPNGRAVSNAVITVRTSGVVNPLPVVYHAAGDIYTPAVQSNPFQSDAHGNYSFAMPDGTYDIEISGGGIPTKILPNINFYDASVTSPSPALGTVTSVGLSVPAPFVVVGTPVTGAGTLSVTSDPLTPGNRIYASPDGAPGGMTARALLAGDLPTAGTPGAYGTPSETLVITTDAYGRTTSVVPTAIEINYSQITAGLPTTLSGHGITDGASINVANNWTKAQNVQRVTLTGPSITIDANASNFFHHVLSANITLNNPTNLGGSSKANTLTVVFRQSGIGGWTITYGSKFKWENGVIGQPDATAGAVTALYMQYDPDDDIILCRFSGKYS